MVEWTTIAHQNYITGPGRSHNFNWPTATALGTTIKRLSGRTRAFMRARIYVRVYVRVRRELMPPLSGHSSDGLLCRDPFFFFFLVGYVSRDTSRIAVYYTRVCARAHGSNKIVKCQPRSAATRVTRKGNTSPKKLGPARHSSLRW